MLATLPDKYYLRHAHELFDFVRHQCAHLLDDKHKQYVDTFTTLSEDGQCLLVRFLSRKPSILKLSSLQYDEIESIPLAMQELIEHRYIGELQTNDWRDLANVLTKPQLLSALKKAQKTINSTTPKAELVELAITQIEASSKIVAELAKPYVVRRQQQTIQYILFLFFGDLDHRFQKFAMRDLGVLKTRKSKTKPVARFDSKEEALSAFELQLRHRRFSEQPTLLREETAYYLLEVETVGHSAAQLRDNLTLAVGNSLCEDQPSTAISLWRTSKHPEATERWIRAAYKQDKAALKIELEAMRETELAAATQVFIEDFYARKYQGKRTSIFTDILREADRIQAIDEAYVNDVEEGVIRSYKKCDTPAYFTENKLWRVVFCFSFWELLFGNTQVQHSEFDRLPALLSNGKFYDTFEQQIEIRLKDFQSPEKIASEFTKLAASHYGKATGLFRWSSKLLDSVLPLIRYSQPEALSAVLRRMAKDYQSAKDGYPDLMIVEDNKIRFEEVKAPGDVLRPNQLVSINRLRRAGYLVSISQIEWAVNPDQEYAVVDIETTGSRKGGNAITEIAVVKIRDQEVISEWSSLINPQRLVPAHITRLTGIDNRMVSDAPLFSEIAEELNAQLQGCIFVAHNVGFDYGFIKAAFESIGLPFRKPKYCTVKNTRRTFPGLKSYSLGALCSHFDIDLPGAHRALNDARATADLLRLIQNKGESDKKVNLFTES